MKQQDCIIVLHYTRCSDSALMLHALSRTFGRKSFFVRSADRFISYFQPLNVLDCDVSSCPKSDILTASAFCEAPSARSEFSLGRNAIRMFLSEVLYRTLEEGDRDSGLFEWCLDQVCALNAMEKDFANFHLLFLLEYCKVLGFAPSVQSLLPFADEFALPIEKLLDNSPSQAMLLPLSGKQRGVICEKLLRYLSFHMEKQLNIRSLEVLGALFAE